jgi:hypothetical protein
MEAFIRKKQGRFGACGCFVVLMEVTLITVSSVVVYGRFKNSVTTQSVYWSLVHFPEDAQKSAENVGQRRTAF